MIPSSADAAAPLISALGAAARPLSGGVGSYSPLLDVIGDARFVLLGEASHGTHEFYQQRAEVTQRLILEKGFTAVAVEGDWPDAYRVNRYVRGQSDDRDANEALSGFRRFPAWMWRNQPVVEFVEWLREYNNHQDEKNKVGFYGMDLYSLFTSMETVLAYLEQVDPPAAERARYRYACFDHFGEDTQAYGYAAHFGLSATCEQETVRQLTDMLHNAQRYTTRDHTRGHDGEAFFQAAQNARLVKNAERYYRSMFGGQVSSWNLRDRHMFETLQALEAHLSRRDAPPRIAVWAHNSHLGDARATEMGESGEWNVGQLMREHYGDAAVLVGFSTYQGAVTAASDWHGAAEIKRVRPGLPASYEQIFHRLGHERFLLVLRDRPELARPLAKPRLQRAIGVIYRPETERLSHYFHTRLMEQFDAMVHIDTTRALVPLEPGTGWLDQKEAAETYPSGL